MLSLLQYDDADQRYVEFHMGIIINY